MAAEYIEASYGKDYVGNTGVDKKDDKKIQDAHEAIRPTDIALSPVVIKNRYPEISSVFISLSGSALRQVR